MRAVSVIYVASALVWAVSSAPVPEEHMGSLTSRTGLDEFSELDLSVHTPQDIANVPGLPEKRAGEILAEPAGDRHAGPIRCIIV
ncbi:hypothetical protein MVEN_00484700 [Mycena venus]|uniref:Uncharacterized protein n=1 Tax=Mycena venus TaxID=2733690 RepID=A0A8H7D8E7_9AGAR|nr:hypothetical protein MVEN_00484700 [Mycena venus]